MIVINSYPYFPCDLEQLFAKIHATEMITWNLHYFTNAKRIFIEELVTRLEQWKKS